MFERSLSKSKLTEALAGLGEDALGDDALRGVSKISSDEGTAREGEDLLPVLVGVCFDRSL